MNSLRGTLKIVVPILLLGALFVGTAVWLGVRNERRMMDAARAAAEPRLASIATLKARLAGLTGYAPEPGGELPDMFPAELTPANALAIHEEDLADLTAPGPVKFRWCSDRATTAACLSRKSEWSPGKPLKWQEKSEAARQMQEFATVRYVLVVKTLSYTAPTYEDSFQFRGGDMHASVFLFELAPNLPLLAEFEFSASLGSTASGPDLHQALRRRCRDALREELGKRAPGAECDAGTY
ncbi:MAG: hypothetical protein HYY18_15190 [Planctomycetes bacterium]|nr:hypothetical protein [Planctomycetota bacterium]